MTKAQKQHAKQQRALLRLRRAAARYSVASATTGFLADDLAFAFAELLAACDAFREGLTARELRKMLRK